MISRRQRPAMIAAPSLSMSKYFQDIFHTPLIFALWDLRLLRDKPSAKGFTIGCGLLAPWAAVKSQANLTLARCDHENKISEVFVYGEISSCH